MRSDKYERRGGVQFSGIGLSGVFSFKDFLAFPSFNAPFFGPILNWTDLSI